MPRIAALLCLVALPAFAQYAPRGGNLRDDLGMEGLYAGAGGGVGLLIAADDTALDGNGLGWDGEVRLGYSFGPSTQIFLSGAWDQAKIGSTDVAVKMVGASVQYHIAGGRNVLAYTRFGLGLALAELPALPGTTGAGLGGWGGIGLEIRLGDQLFLAPELVYRNASVKSSGASLGSNFIGLQLNLVYY